MQSALRETTLKILRYQGYTIDEGDFSLKDDERDTKRDAHILAKAERILHHEGLVTKKAELVKQHMVNGADLEIEKISPVLIKVKPDTEMETLFRWWNLVWWSLPYERSYGRQMRFVLWDRYHKAPMGLIGLQSPILSWAVRDKYLEISADQRDFWINQSLNAQRLGALPPYNNILGGKLVASMMATDYVRRKFKQKYQNVKTVMQDRDIPANLLFITTTGAYGESRVYSRLNVNQRPVAKFLGYTQGSGSFHIPNFLYDEFISFLKGRNYDVGRGYGHGPSRKIRLIGQAMKLLGFRDGINHAVQRSVYFFPFVENVKDVIHKGMRPKWIHRSQNEVAAFWKEKWAIPRSKIDERYLAFSKDKFIENSLAELDQFRKIIQDIKSS
ncbi:MAG: Druantia anti-phage system protein DruA [Pyrinomonadaceae bacterium]